MLVTFQPQLLAAHTNVETNAQSSQLRECALYDQEQVKAFFSHKDGLSWRVMETATATKR
jgi:hypothetical protein